MKVTQVEFVISAVSEEQYPEGSFPEIALAGRSNVGKSSLINCLINRKNLARTSSTPGKTQTINFYRINDLFYFADVPGYGFANVPKTMRDSWKKMMEKYFLHRTSLRAVIQVVDIRHLPSAEDVAMYQFLQYHQLPTIIVATKADKIVKGRWPQHIKGIQSRLSVDTKQLIIPFSSRLRQGKEELWREIEARIGYGINEI